MRPVEEPDINKTSTCLVPAGVQAVWPRVTCADSRAQDLVELTLATYTCVRILSHRAVSFTAVPSELSSATLSGRAARAERAGGHG